MTDRELKKLTRLELLELLLEQTKLNEELQRENAELKKQNSSAYNVQLFEKLTAQMDSALEQVGLLADKFSSLSRDGETLLENAQHTLENLSECGTARKDEAEEKKEPPVVIEKYSVEDENLYCRIIHFYSQRENAGLPLPADMLSDIRARLRGILNERK